MTYSCKTKSIISPCIMATMLALDYSIADCLSVCLSVSLSLSLSLKDLTRISWL